MHARLGLALLVTLVVPLACSSAEEPRPPAPVATRAPIDLDLPDLPPAPAASGYYVWTRDVAGRATTYRIDASGRAVESIDGVLIYAGGEPWRWREDHRAVATQPCERYDDEGALLTSSSEPGSAARITLESLSRDDAQLLVDVPEDAEGAESFDHDVELVASLGPYLFVHESTYVYMCGVHGTSGATAFVWDAERGSVVASPDDFGSLDDARAAAMRDLAADDDGFPPDESTMDLTELVPRFAADGSLELGLQYTAPTCYACSRGRSGSYTKSAIAAAPRVPAMLAPFAKAPDAVRTFLASVAHASVGGWSAVTAR